MRIIQGRKDICLRGSFYVALRIRSLIEDKERWGSLLYPSIPMYCRRAWQVTVSAAGFLLWAELPQQYKAV